VVVRCASRLQSRLEFEQSHLIGFQKSTQGTGAAQLAPLHNGHIECSLSPWPRRRAAHCPGTNAPHTQTGDTLEPLPVQSQAELRPHVHTRTHARTRTQTHKHVTTEVQWSVNVRAAVNVATKHTNVHLPRRRAGGARTSSSVHRSLPRSPHCAVKRWSRIRQRAVSPPEQATSRCPRPQSAVASNQRQSKSKVSADRRNCTRTSTCGPSSPALL